MDTLSGVSTLKKDRFEARLTSEQKQIIQFAADMQAMSLSDFVVTSAQKAAEELIEQRQVIRLSMHDSRMLAEALLDDSQPNEAMKKIARDYKKSGIVST